MGAAVNRAALLLALVVPSLAWAGGWNALEPPPRSFVLLMSDDLSARQYADVAAAIGTAPEVEITAPRLDAMAASGVAGAIHVYPQCFITRASLMQDVNQVESGLWNIQNAASRREGTLAENVCDLVEGFDECGTFGKQAWVVSEGYCDDDGSGCLDDSECSGTCVLTWPNYSQQARGGWGTVEGRNGANPSSLAHWTAWDQRSATRTDPVTFSAGITPETGYLDQRMTDDFAAWWSSHAGRRRFAWVSTHQAHSPHHVPGTSSDCTDTADECVQAHGTDLDARVLGGILDAVADDPRTCVVYVSDNGHFGKFNPTQDGTRSPLVLSEGCLRGAPTPTLGATWDLDDLGRLIREIAGAAPRSSTRASSAYDARYDGGTRLVDAADLGGALWGRCRSRDCAARTAHPGIYRWVVGREIVTNATHQLEITANADLLTPELHAMWLTTDSAQTDVCAGDCAGNLTGGDLASYQELLAMAARHRAHRAGAVPNIDPEVSLTTVSTGQSVSLRTDLSVGADSWATAPQPTYVLCDLNVTDYGDVTAGGQMSGLDADHTVGLGSYTWFTTGAKTFSGSCWDSRDPSNVATVNELVTVE
jgi:hypothetical protein